MRGRAACVLGLILLVPSARQVASAQSGRTLAWDEDPSSSVTGFAITVDGVRTDLGLTPQPPGGSCGCSTPVPFSSGRHSVIISAYNADGETPSGPLIIGPTANAGGPYSGQAGTALSVSGAGSIDTGGTILTYTWAWGDATANTSSSSPTASHTYANSGTFTITLTVSDNYSASHSATSSATITTTAPPAPPPSSTVAVDYSGTTFRLIDPGTSVTLSTLTVGTGSNEALYAGLSTQGATLGSPSCSWNGQAMTNIGGQTLSDNSSVYVYRLVAPHSGNKSLTCQWSNSATVMLGAFSVSGVNQTTPERNVVTSSGFSTSPSISISSASGDMSFAVGVNGGADWTNSSQTVVWLDSSGVAWNGAASRAAGSSSNTHGFTIAEGYSLLWGLIGLDIVAAP
jgi:PKD repeat protein